MAELEARIHKSMTCLILFELELIQICINFVNQSSKSDRSAVVTWIQLVIFGKIWGPVIWGNNVIFQILWFSILIHNSGILYLPPKSFMYLPSGVWEVHKGSPWVSVFIYLPHTCREVHKGFGRLDIPILWPPIDTTKNTFYSPEVENSIYAPRRREKRVFFTDWEVNKGFSTELEGGARGWG